MKRKLSSTELLFSKVKTEDDPEGIGSLISDNEANFEEFDENGLNLLHIAVYNNFIKNVEVLLLYGLDLEEVTLNGQTSLHLACKFGHIDIVRLLIDRGANVKAFDINGDNSLLLALYEGKVEIVNYLLEQTDIDLNMQNSNGHMAIHIASKFGYLSILKQILQKDPDQLNAKDKNQNTPLMHAVRDNKIEIVKHLLAQTAVEVDVRSAAKNTALHIAVAGSNLEIFKLILAIAPGLLNAKGYNNFTPLMAVVTEGKEEIVQYLLEQGGVEIDARNSDGNAAVHMAAMNGHLAILQQILVRAPRLLNAKGYNGFTPLMQAVTEGKEEIVHYLFEKEEVEIYAQSSNGNTALHVAAAKGHLSILQQILVRAPRLLNAKGYNGFTPLMQAVSNGQAGIVEYLLSQEEVEIYAQNSDGNAAVHMAAMNGHLAILQQILAIAPDLLNDEGCNDFTPLMHAVIEGKEEIVRYLLEQEEVEIDVRNSDGNAAVHMAAMNGHLSILQQILVRAPRLLNAKGYNGFTPLMQAATEGKEEIVQYLFEQVGVGINVRNSDGNTAIHLAAMKGHLTIFQQILAGAPELLNDEGCNGFTPLMQAVSNGQAEIVEYLLSQEEVEIDARNRDGNTALHIAAMRGHLGILQQILLIAPELLNDKGYNDFTPLMYAIKSGKSFVGHEAYRYQENYDKLSQYVKSSTLDDKLLRNFLEFYQLQRQMGQANPSPLLSAAQSKTEVAEYLIEHTDIIVSFPGIQRDSALHLAALYSNERVVMRMSEKFPALINLRNSLTQETSFSLISKRITNISRKLEEILSQLEEATKQTQDVGVKKQLQDIHEEIVYEYGLYIKLFVMFLERGVTKDANEILWRDKSNDQIQDTIRYVFHIGSGFDLEKLPINQLYEVTYLKFTSIIKSYAQNEKKIAKAINFFGKKYNPLEKVFFCEGLRKLIVEYLGWQQQWPSVSEIESLIQQMSIYSPITNKVDLEALLQAESISVGDAKYREIFVKYASSQYFIALLMESAPYANELLHLKTISSLLKVNIITYYNDAQTAWQLLHKDATSQIKIYQYEQNIFSEKTPLSTTNKLKRVHDTDLSSDELPPKAPYSAGVSVSVDFSGILPGNALVGEDWNKKSNKFIDKYFPFLPRINVESYPAIQDDSVNIQAKGNDNAVRLDSYILSAIKAIKILGLDLPKLVLEPTWDNADLAYRDIIHFGIMNSHGNPYLVALSMLDFIYQVSQADYKEAIMQTLITIGYTGLSISLSKFVMISPLLINAYAAYQLTHLTIDIYSFYLYCQTPEGKYNSSVAYGKLYKQLGYQDQAKDSFIEATKISLEHKEIYNNNFEEIHKFTMMFGIIVDFCPVDLNYCN